MSIQTRDHSEPAAPGVWQDVRRWLRLALLLLMGGWIAPAWSMPILSDFEANLETVTGRDGFTRVSLLAGGMFGPGGFAGGLVDWDIGDAAPPDDGLWWAQDPTSGSPPPDDSRVLSFLFDETGNFMGIEPVPFSLLIGYPPDDIMPEREVHGVLDFSGVFGVTPGSLENISGLRVTNLDGSVETFAPFSIRNVPEPGTLALLVLGLAGLAYTRRRRPSRVRQLTATALPKPGLQKSGCRCDRFGRR